MEVTDKTINIFVLGDLVLDHAIFVKGKVKPYQAIGTQIGFDVKHRIDTAGGAANYARILASLSRGSTYLWGVAGRSPWGAFSRVLEFSQRYDAAASDIFFRGIHDEGIIMNTITRIITLDGNRQEHPFRFDDVGQVSITEDHARNALNHLRNAHNGHKGAGVAAIIIGDVDMNTLHPSLIKGIADFASDNGIPLFIDPKRGLKKYKGISATAILPNLKEWCELTGEEREYEQWRSCLGSAGGLEKIAQHSLEHLHNFTYHIIKCDSEGAVIIGPAENRNHFVVYKIPPHPPQTTHRELPYQLGCGDILTAVIALEYGGSNPRLHQMERMLQSFNTANAVVAAYRETSWHRMPTRNDVIRLNTPAPEIKESLIITTATRYLPETSLVNMRSAETCIPQLVSIDKRYRDCIKKLLGFLSSGWAEETLSSAILTARGGSGKTEICKALEAILKTENIHVIEFDKQVKASKNIQDIDDAIIHEWNELKNDQSESNAILFTVDEAFGRGSHLLNGKNGVLFIEAGHSRRARFLLIDADYEQYRNCLSGSQFLTRCKVFELPGIAEHPKDISYVFAAGCFKLAAKYSNGNGSKGIERLICEQNVLLAVIDWVLNMEESEQSGRSIFKAGVAAYEEAVKHYKNNGVLNIQVDHLDSKIKGYAPKSNPYIESRTIEFQK